MRVFAQTGHRLEHDREQDHTGANREIHAATRCAVARIARPHATAALGSHTPGRFGHYRCMSARSEQIVLDFLSRTADAAHGTLRSDERVRFIARLRASIEQRRREAGAVEPAEVRQILAAFGDPRALVEREVRRLHEASVASASGSGEARAAANGGAPGAAQPAAFDLVAAARRFARELLALLLLGLGGMLLPIPLWLIGAAIGLTSRVWGAADKLAGIGGPLLVTVAGVGVVGALNKNPSIPVDLHAYVAAAHAHAPLLMRIGAVAGAGYLAARLLRASAGRPSRSADRRRYRTGGR